MIYMIDDMIYDRSVVMSSDSAIFSHTLHYTLYTRRLLNN